MRTLPSGQRARLAQDHAAHVQVEIQDADGAWRDLRAIVGADWLVGVTWTADIDQPVMQGTVMLLREADTPGVPGTSLVPLMSESPANNIGGSYAPLLNAGRGIRIATAITAPGAAPASGDWTPLLEGKIDRPAWGQNPMVLEFRDLGARLLDTTIEEERLYGSAGGTALETVMQQILDDNLGAGTVVLHVPESPGWYLPEGTIDRVSVLEALRTLALQIGWDVRYKYDDAGQFRLTLYAPQREKATPDDTIGPEEYLDITDLDISDADVRNVVRVRFIEGTTGMEQSALASSAGSIAEFGRRYMEIGEGSSSNIDTMAEAQAMADAAVHDLATPPATQATEHLHWPPVELGDLYTWRANGVHYDEDQSWAVTGFAHDFRPDGTHRSTLRVRGSVAGAYKTWLLTRNGAFDALSRGPVPIIGAMGGEASAFGGGPEREGMVWLPIRFTKETERVELYAVEFPTSPVPIPELSESRKAWTVRRQDGAVASADDWATWAMVATRMGWYRKVIALGIGYDGARGPTVVREAQAEDVGTGPSAAPTDLQVTTLDDLNRVTFHQQDPLAAHLILRNGLVLAELLPEVGGAAGDLRTFDDAQVDTGIPYTYQVCAFRAYQTSALLTAALGAAGDDPLAPKWAAGYPKGAIAGGVAVAQFAWDAHPTTTAITVEKASTLTGGGGGLGYYADLVGPFTGGGAIPAGSASSAAYAAGATAFVRLRADFADGTRRYSVPAAVMWGEQPYGKPGWVPPTPIILEGGAVLFAWYVDDARVTAIALERPSALVAEALAGIWTEVHRTTDPAQLARGTATVSGLATDVSYRVRAYYPGGDTVSIAIRPHG